MKITFLGTRGGIAISSKIHALHSSLLVTTEHACVRFDYGTDWLTQNWIATTQALFITHAHDDHVGGLRHGVPCPVYVTEDTWSLLPKHALQEHTIIQPYQEYTFNQLVITPIPVEHSLTAPALGYRICDNNKTIFYVPDVAAIPNYKTVLNAVAVYIGDGALLTRFILLRQQDSVVVGHAPIIEQLRWCAEAGVTRVIITHCGSEIVRQDRAVIAEQVFELGKQYGIQVYVAYDGLELTI